MSFTPHSPYRETTALWRRIGVAMWILSVTSAGANQVMNQQRPTDTLVHTVNFEFAEDIVSALEFQRLNRVVATLKSNIRPLKVRGFTDSIGFQTYNDDLALRRAEAVRRALVSQGIPASRIDVAGLGRSDYVADNRREATRRLNRRVEIHTENQRRDDSETDLHPREHDVDVSRVSDPRRVGRYSELTAVPKPGQANPLESLITLTFPGQIQSVGQALNHVLARSGWQLADAAASDPTLPRLMGLPLPESQRSLGPIAVVDALGVLCGDAYTVVVDPVNRLISCELRSSYMALVTSTPQPTSDTGVPDDRD